MLPVILFVAGVTPATHPQGDVSDVGGYPACHVLNGLDDVQILVAGNPAQHDITNCLNVIIKDEIISAPNRNQRRKLKMAYKPNLDKSSVERNENPHRRGPAPRDRPGRVAHGARRPA